MRMKNDKDMVTETQNDQVTIDLPKFPQVVTGTAGIRMQRFHLVSLSPPCLPLSSPSFLLLLRVENVMF